MVFEDEHFKCISCGQINLIAQSKQLLENEPRTEWTIKTTVSARRKFKEICSRRGVDFSDGLLYLIGLDTKEQLGRNAQVDFGIPGTSTK